MNNQEKEIRNLIESANIRLFESKKIISELKNKLQNEETVYIELKIQLENLQVRLKKFLNSLPDDTEENQRQAEIDSRFKGKLDYLLKNIK